MIHRGIRQMVLDQFGAAAWANIEASLEVGPEHFVSGQVYDDALTISLITAASGKIGMTTGECLRAFGQYWIQFAERGSYGAMMDFTGSDLPGFIANLDRLHQAVQVAMPMAQVPSFRIVAQDPAWLDVEYRSEREGLEPFVTGLLEGLLERFNRKGTIERRPNPGNAAMFRINLETKP